MRRTKHLFGAAVVSLVLAPAAAFAGGVSDEVDSEIPCLYVVQDGDTLGSIAKEFFGDTAKSADLAVLNPQIEDSEMLTVGQTVALRDCPEEGTDVPPEADPTAAEILGEADDDLIRFDFEEEELKFFVTQTHYTYITPRQARPIATIIGNRNEQNFYGNTSVVYINAGKDAELRAGDRFTIYRDREVVAHPATERQVGFLNRVLGDLVVLRVDEESSICRVDRGADTITPGDKVRPYIQVPLEYHPVANEAEMSAMLIGTPGPLTDLVEQRTFFLDSGKGDGVQVGNMVTVYREGLPVADPETGRALAQPDEVVGRAIVFRVERDASSAWVYQSDRNLRTGDRVDFELDEQ